MKQHKTKGERLHEQLTECLASNPKGLPYSQCSRECVEENYWVIDKGGNECFSSQKLKNQQPFEVRSLDANGAAKKSWLVCVDEGLIKSQKSNNEPRCDNLLFNDDIFFFVEAKMRVMDKKWEQEFDDAIKNKIPKTKQLLDSKMGEFGYAIAQKIGIAIPFAGTNSRVPRKKTLYNEEQSFLEAREKLEKWVTKLTLSETIVL